MGKASRRKRERRLARGAPATGAVAVDAGHHQRTNMDDHELAFVAVPGWGGRRLGAGRSRIYETNAARQAAYRQRRLK